MITFWPLCWSGWVRGWNSPLSHSRRKAALTGSVAPWVIALTPLDGDLLQLFQWLSPSLPVGSYAYSHGLEWAMAAGEVHDAASLHCWIADILRFGAGRNDAILLTHGMTAGADLDALDDLARALAGSAERLREIEEQGAAFALTTAAITGRRFQARPQQLAVAQSVQSLGLRRETVIALFLHAFAANLVFAAVRFVPIGQTAGQSVLAAMHPLITTLADAAAQAPLGTIGTAAFRADMAAMQHETQSVRLFRT